MLTSSVPTDAWISGGISPDRRERADRRYSNSRPARRGCADGALAVREELRSRLLVDESLNRLYNIVSQIGLRILFFDENERYVGRYEDATKGDHQTACAEREFNQDSAETVAAKTKVCGPRNQDNIQIYPRRMEQFVALNLCCHRGLNQKWLGKCDPITKVAEGDGHVDKLSAYGCLDIGGDLTR